MNLFLQTYTPEETEGHLHTVEQAVERLPFTLAYPVAQARLKMERGEYAGMMNHILDFFEIATQYTSCVLFKLLEKHSNNPDVSKILVGVVNKIDSKRPLSFGDWINDIFTPLCIAAGKHLPELPLVASLVEHVCNRKRNILLGGKHDASIVQIRNEYRGHSTTLSDDIYRGVSFTLEPRLLAFIKALLPLADYDIIAFSQGTSFSMKGADNTKELQRSPGADGHYCLEKDGKIIDLYPLVFLSPEKYVYVFQSLKDENISYISSNINAVTLISDDRNEDFDHALQAIVPSFDISRDLNWEECSTLFRLESQRFMRRVYGEKKYNAELFVERTGLTEALNEFLASEATLFPMLGEAGQGKTSQLCYWTESMLDSGKAVLIFGCSDFASATLEAQLKRVLDFSPRKNIAKILDSVHDKAVRAGVKIPILFDAINECIHYAGCENTDEAPLVLFNDIRRLLIKPEYTHFKVLFTCRTFTWKTLLQRHVQATDPLVFNASGDEKYNVRGFSSDETRSAYRIYGRLYQMTTRFEEIDPRTLIRIKDPLVMKFTCTNYLCRALPESTDEYTSIALFRKMMSDIGNSYAGNLQLEVVRGVARYFLEGYLSGNPIDSVSSEVLREAYSEPKHPLHHLATLIYKKDGITIAYAELLNKAERPILREGRRAGEDVANIQFVYERFLEYAMAEVLRTTTEGKIDYVALLHSATVNVVFLGCLRNALLMEVLNGSGLDTLVSLAIENRDDYKVMQLVTDTIDSMVRENYENEIFSLLDKMVVYNVENGEALTERFNAVTARIESNNADEAIIEEHKRLSRSLSPVMHLRQLASVSLINGILLTDYFAGKLYSHDAMEMLWRIMSDNIIEVRNDACMYCYYLSNKKYTLDNTPLAENLSVMIVREMYAVIKSHNIVVNAVVRRLRNRLVFFLETATRLCVLLLIDALVTYHDREQAALLLDEINGVMRYFTFNFNIVRLVMPLLQIIMRKQITFQSDYVNNAVEYQQFWDSSVIPVTSGAEDWSRDKMPTLISFLHHFRRFASQPDSPECRSEEERFARFVPVMLSAYHTGDSFTYFGCERILVVMGSSKWDNVAPLVRKIFTPEYRQSKWWDYTQMSVLYSLYQIAVYLPDDCKELLDFYTAESRDWTKRCRGLFKARNSHRANPTGLYKRNVLNWYCVVYCAHKGDGVAHEGDAHAAPLMYELIDEAVATRDKELLYHIVENVSELITDFGYIHTALDIVKYLMAKFSTVESVAEFDSISLSRAGCYQFDLVKLIGNLFSTAKNYFPDEINNFIRKEILDLRFPGIESYREEILNYNPSGETLSDLLTHRFGNFLMWSLLNEKSVDDFATEAMISAVGSKDCFGWYEKVIRLLVRHMFGVKL